MKSMFLKKLAMLLIKIKPDRVVMSFMVTSLLIMLALLIAWPEQLRLSLVPLQSVLKLWPKRLTIPAAVQIEKGSNSLPAWLRPWFSQPLRYGLDIQGGTQVTLSAQMDEIPAADRPTALASVVEVLRRRVDMFGVSETNIRTAEFQNQYRVIVELPGISQPEAALQLIGQTAQLQFRELDPALDATAAARATFNDFQPTDLTGQQLERALVQFHPQTGEPLVSLQFDTAGAQLFAEITGRNVGKPLAIFLDEYPVSFPTVNEAIYGGQAQISGQFDLTTAQTLATQLNAGALPVPIAVVEQTTIGPTLGQESLALSLRAGLIGLLVVAIFMITVYGWSGVLAVIGLIAYGIVTIALYKLIPVTLTLPGVAGLMLSIGMAVDANILTFERIKDELRAGSTWNEAVRLGFGRAWDSIKDANLATLTICFILFNPLEWGWLHTSGPVRGFALTLALGIGVSLFTGVWYSRLMLRLFLAPPRSTIKPSGNGRHNTNGVGENRVGVNRINRAGENGDGENGGGRGGVVENRVGAKGRSGSNQKTSSLLARFKLPRFKLRERI